MTTVQSRTLSYVNISDVLTHLGFGEADQETIIHYGFDGVSFGDSMFTLVGNKFALECIIDGADIVMNHGSPVPIDSEIRRRYWDVVGQDDYINMEG